MKTMLTLSFSNKQRGAVLVFSMIMLMLLTLVSVAMIQQNKQELVMAANARNNDIVFTELEFQLAEAEKMVDKKRYVDGTGKLFNCNVMPTFTSIEYQDFSILIEKTYNPYTNSIGDNELYTVKSKIIGVACLKTLGGVEEVCYEDDILNTIDDSTGFTDNACGSLISNTGTPFGCPTEVYTIQTSLEDKASGSEQTIETRYIVNCTGDMN